MCTCYKYWSGPSQKCELHSVINESQAGFRKHKSTMHTTFVIIIDFKKAFDSIRHQKLWNALQRKGIWGRFLEIYKCMYSKLKYYVEFDDV